MTRSLRNPTCALAPAGWQCIREMGHDGPCAAAPLTGSGACPDIDRCMAVGCHADCGPDESRRGLVRFRVVRWAIYLAAGVLFTGAVLGEIACKSWHHWCREWRDFVRTVRDAEGSWR